MWKVICFVDDEYLENELNHYQPIEVIIVNVNSVGGGKALIKLSSEEPK